MRDSGPGFRCRALSGIRSPNTLALYSPRAVHNCSWLWAPALESSQNPYTLLDKNKLRRRAPRNGLSSPGSTACSWRSVKRSAGSGMTFFDNIHEIERLKRTGVSRPQPINWGSDTPVVTGRATASVGAQIQNNDECSLLRDVFICNSLQARIL